MRQKILIPILLLLIMVLDAQAQTDQKRYFPILVKSMSYDNHWRLIKPKPSSNYVKNPSAETAGNFSSSGGATVTRSSTYQKYGLYSYRIQASGAGEGVDLDLSTLTNDEHFVSVRVRSPNPPVQAKLNSTTKNLALIGRIDADWNLYGVSFAAGEANGATAVEVLTTEAGDFNVDGVQVEPEGLTTYIDGTQEGCLWIGTAHASRSERSGESRAGGELKDFWREYNFHVQRVIGAGSTSKDISIDSYALLPGGELNNTKVQSRTFSIVGKFIADTEEELYKSRQALRKELALDTYDGSQPFRLRFGGATVQKEIAGFYQNGLEGDLAVFYGDIEVDDNKPLRRTRYTENASIQFLSPDPYWYEVGESASLLDTNDSATFRIVAGRLKSTGQWDNLGPPSASGTYVQIWAVAEDDTYVYFGGEFTNFNNIANADNIVRWHKRDKVWSALGGGLNDAVRAIAVAPNGDVYIGGEFTNAGGELAADYLTRWDGSNYNAVGTPNTGSASITIVRALVFDHAGILFVGGNFINWANIADADYIVGWDGSSYNALSPLDSEVRALAVGLDNTLYIGGIFTFYANRFASWNGSSLSSIGSLNNSVETIAVAPDGKVYLGGGFTSPETRIAYYNGTSIVGMGSGANGIVYEIAIGDDGTAWVFGHFTEIGGLNVLSTQMARWNGSSYSHTDLFIENGPSVFSAVIGNPDPIVKQNYDIWIGHSIERSGTYGGLVTLTNKGSVAVFPKIIYERSGGTSAIIKTLKNRRTGRELLFNYSLLDGETLTIDLSPLNKSIVSNFSGSRLDAILINSDFGTWSLLPDNNDITSFIEESGSPTITAYMLWRDAFDGYD